MRFSLFTTLALSALAAADEIFVTVGKDGELAFMPANITAKEGDKVIFVFYSQDHAVATADFNAPCRPSTGDGGFFSDFQPTSDGPANNTFQVNITDSNPRWFYCPQTTGDHCQHGMVGVINPPTNKTLKDFAAAAAKAPQSTAPDSSFGGVLVALNATDFNSTDSNSNTTSAGNGTSTGTGTSPSPTSGAAALVNIAPVALAVSLFVAMLS